MHLMYYLDANGKRAYTLKVCTFSLNGIFACLRGFGWVGGWSWSGGKRWCHGYWDILHRHLGGRVQEVANR